MKAFGWVLVFFLVACGTNKGQSKDPLETPPPNVGPSTFNIKDNWRPVSKSCDGTAISALPHESYKIDKDNYFMRVGRLSETDEELCKIGYLYQRVIQSFHTTSSGTKLYLESAILMGSKAKKNCWKKEGGVPEGAATVDEVVDFGPEELNFKLVADADSLLIELDKVSDCPNGTLKVLLHKAE